jgi:tetratricopeptide (TPR) repeat protein
VQKRPGLVLGLTFFYLAILPASRIVGERSVGPHLAERYLYMPSIGMVIVLAFGLAWLVQKFNLKTATVPVLAALVFMTPLTLARNAQWTSTLRLAEADYRINPNSDKLLQTLVSTLLMKGDLAQASALCDENEARLGRLWYLAGFCGQVYASRKSFDKAERAFISATKSKTGAAAAHYGLAVMYLGQNRTNEATEQFDLAIATEKQPFMQEYLTAEKLLRLNPTDPDRLQEARTHMEKCIELQPQFYHGRQRLEEIKAMVKAAQRRRQ